MREDSGGRALDLQGRNLENWVEPARSHLAPATTMKDEEIGSQIETDTTTPLALWVNLKYFNAIPPPPTYRYNYDIII